MCTAFTCSIFKLTHSSKSCPQAQLDYIDINILSFPKVAKMFSVPTCEAFPRTCIQLLTRTSERFCFASSVSASELHIFILRCED